MPINLAFMSNGDSAGTVMDFRYAFFYWLLYFEKVEYEIDQKLGITGPADVEKLGKSLGIANPQ